MTSKTTKETQEPVQRGIEDDAPPAYAGPPSTSIPVLSNETNQSSALAPTPSASSRSSRPAHHHTLPEDQAKQSIARFGNPYATNSTWSPSDQDARLRKLPSLAFTMRLQQRFARKAGDIFDPPCPSMQRPIPSSTAKDSPFDPYQCMGKGDLASDGFKSIFLGAVMAPRDVSSADWFRFIQDLTVASRLSGAQEALAGITPITKRLLLPGALVTRLIRCSVVRKREPLIFECVEEWNARFFATRGIDVFIHNGSERLTSTEVGGTIPPLEAMYWRNNSKAPQLIDTYSDSSDSSDDEDVNQPQGTTATSIRDGKRQMRQDRRQLKMERRAQRRAQRRQRSNGDASSGDKVMMMAVAHQKPTSQPGPAVLAQAVLTDEAPSYNAHTQPNNMDAQSKKS